MADMNVQLPDDLAREIEAEIEAGYAKSIDAVVVQAVRTHLAGMAALRRSLDEAEEEYRRDGGVSWEEIEAEIEANLESGN